MELIRRLDTLNLPLGPQSRRPRALWLAATLLPGMVLCGIGGYLWHKHRRPPEVITTIVSKPPAPPKREEIDMLALRSYALTVLQEGLRDGKVPPSRTFSCWPP